ncbi:hypothetical protein KIPE111705_33400 [Kibdelosporangium persicum]|uniref:Immunity protein 35 n=1 Tax=Kibdelosporangium persicum TaxID=2698649 RepID=A0ABX2EZP3_9PSEU|nr:hypothetical protein [Kibdelosporangium persicum]NRN64138.1 hypothetical protein [Kibdelosporangium persicum]
MTDQTELEERAAALVAGQAPRLFAAVVHKNVHSTVIGWGMQFEDSAYMVSADGRNQYFLAAAENALNYVRDEPDVVKDIVWVGPSTR